MFQDRSEVDKILSALAEQIAATNSEQFDLIVCGGSALNALGLVSRTTKDVDVLAMVNHKNMDRLILESAKPLPELILRAAGKVQRDFRLPEEWINPGPTSALDLGLPEGLLDRCEKREYGPALTVRFLSRYDQIHFKLYAAADQGGKHYEDLLNLKPTPEEIEAAARWSMTHDVSEGYKLTLKNLIEKMGFTDVAHRL